MSRLQVTVVVEINEITDDYNDFQHATSVENIVDTRLDSLASEIALKFSGRYDEITFKRRVTK